MAKSDRQASRNSDPPGEEVLVLVWNLVNQLDAMVAYWDRDQVCRFANKAYLDWFGIEESKIVGGTLRQLLGPLYDLNRPFIRAAYKGERQVFERAIPSPQGGVRHSLATYLPHVVDGRVEGIFVHVADVGPLKRLEWELKASIDRAEQQATHDYLTGLPNRLMMGSKIEFAIAEASRSSGGFALLCADLDQFKVINDTYGHIEGDRFLVEIALRIKHAIREGDSVFRFGGDEFIVLSSQETSAPDVANLAARIQLEVSRPLYIGGTKVLPGVSIGGAAFPADGRTENELMKASDAALYAAKASGRNRTVFASGLGEKG